MRKMILKLLWTCILPLIGKASVKFHIDFTWYDIFTSTITKKLLKEDCRYKGQQNNEIAHTYMHYTLIKHAWVYIASGKIKLILGVAKTMKSGRYLILYIRSTVIIRGSVVECECVRERELYDGVLLVKFLYYLDIQDSWVKIAVRWVVLTLFTSSKCNI